MALQLADVCLKALNCYHCFNFIKNGEFKTAQDLCGFVITPIGFLTKILEKMENGKDEN